MKDSWKKLASENPADIADTVRSMLATRQDDIKDYDNTGTMISWNKVAKVPASSGDTTGDMAGNFNFDGAYLYVCSSVNGNLTWGRTALGSW